MSTSSFKPVPAEPVSEKDGLIHGVSAFELQILGQKCLDARATAYWVEGRIIYLTRLYIRPILTLPCRRIPPPPPQPHLSLHLHNPHIISGANVENASYPVGTCAERVAMGTAIVSGHKLGDFKAVAVATDMDECASPCGMCRQFLREFLGLDVPIFMFSKEGKFIVKTMGELLPMSFGPDVLPPREVLKKGLEEDKAKMA